MTLSPYSDALRREAAALGTATLHEAGGKIGALPRRLRPLSTAWAVAGAAYTVASPAGDNLWLHEALVRAEPGDILVVQTGELDFGCFGEVMAVAAQTRGIGGLVIDGGVRDVNPIVALGFPVWSSTISIRGTGKDPRLSGGLGTRLRLEGVLICPGDLVVADADGVVALPRDDAERIVATGRVRADEEAVMFERLRAGETTFDLYGLPRVE